MRDFDLIFVYNKRKGVPIYSFTCGNPFLALFVKETILCQLNCHGILAENYFTVNGGFILFMDSQFFSIDLHVCPYANNHYLDYCSFVVSSEIKSVTFSTLFFSKIVLASLVPLHFFFFLCIFLWIFL